VICSDLRKLKDFIGIQMLNKILRHILGFSNSSFIAYLFGFQNLYLNSNYKNPKRKFRKNLEKEFMLAKFYTEGKPFKINAKRFQPKTLDTIE